MTMTRQEIFTGTYEHFSKPDAVFGWNGDACVYRGRNGEKCAIGCHIPYDLYDPDIEGFSVSVAAINGGYRTGNDVRAKKLIFIIDTLFGADDINFLQDLQDLHDDYADGERSVKDFLEALRFFAEDRDLKY